MSREDLDRKDEVHYVASLKIEKVVRKLKLPTGTERGVEDVTHMTIKAKDLDDLKSRISAHVDLVEDD
jgi:hypothetical protein